ncbi:protoheme IX farnesyltransferase [Hyphobacterium sp. CCMP332]|nr:protoheme IX farnesyltransferase [Hyphobacterium sp. CCMP332]
MNKIKSYIELTKLRLSLLVAFSGAFGYLMGHSGGFDWFKFSMFIIGGFMLTGASNAINQILEKDLDKLMPRTMNRPLPSGRMEVFQAVLFSAILIVLGTIVLALFVNIPSALLTILSLVLYAFAYTPLKQKSPISVLVGAVPGALPPLIGWVAATGNLGMGAIVLFSIQFIWQFPHFWSIAWVQSEAYSKAGFKMLPSALGPDRKTAIHMMMYSLFLLPLGLLPAKMGLTGIWSAVILSIAAIAFIWATFVHVRKCEKKSALKIMFGSFIYLPLIQIALILDKI